MVCVSMPVREHLELMESARIEVEVQREAATTRREGLHVWAQGLLANPMTTRWGCVQRLWQTETSCGCHLETQGATGRWHAWSHVRPSLTRCGVQLYVG